jgi:hypothetical protein
MRDALRDGLNTHNRFAKEHSMQRQSPSTWASLAIATLLAACGSGGNGVSGSGGAPAGGGGAGATGGTIGAGGTGSGGAPAGDAAGSGGALADTGTAPDTGMGSDASAPPVSADRFLAQCFEGLRPLQGWFIRAAKRSADGKVQVGLAVETADRFGTSGTSPFALVRFAIVADGKMACLTSPPAGAYKVSHHNCKDSASVTVEDVRYELSDPVSPITQISAFAGTTRLWGPLPLSVASCTAGRSDPASEMKCADSSSSPCP